MSSLQNWKSQRLIGFPCRLPKLDEEWALDRIGAPLSIRFGGKSAAQVKRIRALAGRCLIACRASAGKIKSGQHRLFFRQPSAVDVVPRENPGCFFRIWPVKIAVDIA